MREELNYGALLSLPLIRGERKLAIVVDFFFFCLFIFMSLSTSVGYPCYLWAAWSHYICAFYLLFAVVYVSWRKILPG